MDIPQIYAIVFLVLWALYFFGALVNSGSLFDAVFGGLVCAMTITMILFLVVGVVALALFGSH